MRAAVLHESPGDLVIDDLTVAKPVGREVLVRTAHAGLCHSDLHFMEGLWPHPMPVVMGHESAGVVEAVGDQVTEFSPGDHVISCLSVFCGTCHMCLRGKPYLCANQNTLNRAPDQTPRLSTAGGEFVHQGMRLGGFAEEMLVHENALVKVREDMPLDRAALIGCGVTTGVGAVIRTAQVEPGATVAVVGCGGIGLSAVQGGRLAGASRVIAIDISDQKLQVARTMGATDTVNAADTDAVAEVIEMTKGGVDYSFEAIGRAETVEQAFAMLAPTGMAVAIGMVPLGQKVSVPAHELLSEKKLTGSRMGSNVFRVDMPYYVDLYLDGRLLLDEMISGTIRLDQINEGYEWLKKGEATRTVIDFSLS